MKKQISPKYIAYLLENYGDVRLCGKGWCTLTFFFPPGMQDEARRLKKIFPHTRKLNKNGVPPDVRKYTSEKYGVKWAVGWGRPTSAKVFAVAYPYLCERHRDIARWLIAIDAWKTSNRRFTYLIKSGKRISYAKLGFLAFHRRKKMAKEFFKKRLAPACMVIKQTCPNRNPDALNVTVKETE